jgi:esterase/lipase superfamily enzyme
MNGELGADETPAPKSHMPCALGVKAAHCGFDPHKTILGGLIVRVWLSCLMGIAGSLIFGLAAGAQTRTDDWVLLHSAEIDPKGAYQVVTLASGTPRTVAIRLTMKSGSVRLSRIAVTYGNGQVHFETPAENRPIMLGDGQHTNPIDEREESRIVEAITLSFSPASQTTAAATIEVWGLRPPTIAQPNSVVRPRGTGGIAKSGESPKRRYVEVPVFYGTTRQQENDRIKNNRKLANFSGEQGPDMTLGRAIVTVPIEREPGSIPRPETDLFIARIAFRNEDPNRDFTIAAVDVMKKDQFILEMRKQVQLSARFKGQAFVFVHGYNVSFDDAIFRTAQIAYDILFDGPAVAFSWPSRGGTWDYRHDIDTAKASRDGLRQLLEIISRDTGANAINLVAHSMGNDPVIEVLREQAEILARGGQATDLQLNEIVLAAPDISRQVFEQFAARFVSLARGGVTLYASNNDRAMAASKSVAGGLVRAGDVPKTGIVIVPGVESIDISEASTSFFSTNHSTFADRAHLVSDMQLLLERAKDKHPPDIRFRVYQTQGTEQKTWWRYRKN